MAPASTRHAPRDEAARSSRDGRHAAAKRCTARPRRRPEVRVREQRATHVRAPAPPRRGARWNGRGDAGEGESECFRIRFGGCGACGAAGLGNRARHSRRRCEGGLVGTRPSFARRRRCADSGPVGTGPVSRAIWRWQRSRCRCSAMGSAAVRRVTAESWPVRSCRLCAGSCESSGSRLELSLFFSRAPRSARAPTGGARQRVRAPCSGVRGANQSPSLARRRSCRRSISFWCIFQTRDSERWMSSPISRIGSSSQYFR